jgi:hypothetical protein
VIGLSGQASSSTVKDSLMKTFTFSREDCTFVTARGAQHMLYTALVFKKGSQLMLRLVSINEDECSAVAEGRIPLVDMVRARPRSELSAHIGSRLVQIFL